MVEEFRLVVPVLREEEICIADAGETQVDVRGDPNRSFMFDHSGPVYVPGSKTVIAVPFEGEEPDFFRIRPPTHGSAPPRAEIRDGELFLTLPFDSPLVIRPLLALLRTVQVFRIPSSL
jgi:hypothetical protein